MNKEEEKIIIKEIQEYLKKRIKIDNKILKELEEDINKKEKLEKIRNKYK